MIDGDAVQEAYDAMNRAYDEATNEVPKPAASDFSDEAQEQRGLIYSFVARSAGVEVDDRAVRDFMLQYGSDRAVADGLLPGTHAWAEAAASFGAAWARGFIMGLFAAGSEEVR